MDKKEHTHTHNHDHEHGHSHEVSSVGKAFFFAAAINIVFIICEILFGIFANSKALIADGTHNISDVLGLFLSWGALVLSQKIPKGRYTYGYKPATTLSVLLSSALIFAAAGGIIWSAIHSLGKVLETQSILIMSVASVGILINGFSAYLLSKNNDDLNVKTAFLHFVGDALVSLGVVVTGIIIYFTGLSILDPIVSVLISLFIIYSSWGVLKEGINLSLHAVPKGYSLEKIRSHLEKLNGVTKVHDLHIWSMSTKEVALTAHLVIPNYSGDDEILHGVINELKHKFKIAHATIQIEKGDKDCDLEPENIV